MTRNALVVALLAVPSSGPVVGQEVSVVRLLDFRTAVADDWFVVNDGVMGGRSRSDLTDAGGGVAVFEGYLSLENNGGFASVRTQVPAGAMAGASRIVLRVRGDGKQYQLRLRPSTRFDGVAFGASFPTDAGQWTTVEIPLRAFEPSFRGYRPRNVGPLDPARISQIGVMLTDKQVGAFRLEIEWIGFVVGEG